MTEQEERKALALKAKGTAFEIIYQPRREPPKPTAAQVRQRKAIERQAAKRAAQRAKAVAGRMTTAITLPGSLPAKKILRDNTTSPFCVAIPKQADKDKQMRMKGST